jgi:hypothetical protein
MTAVSGNGRRGPRQPDGFAPFDALATLSEVQRQGWDATAQVITRFIDLLDAAAAPRSDDGGEAPGSDHESEIGQLRKNVARTLDLYTDLVRRSFESYADLMEQRLRVRGVRLHADDGQPALLTMRGAAGADAIATVWLHNTTERSADAVLRLTDLTAPDGSDIPASAGRFDPPTVNIGAGVSDSVRLTIQIREAVPGVYWGYVLAVGLPDAALPVRLVVSDEPHGPPP